MAPMIGFRKHRPHSTRVFPQPAKDQYDGGACFQALCRHEPCPAAMKRLVTQAYALDMKALARGGWLFPFSTYEWVWRTYNGTKTISMTTTVLQDHSTGDCSSR
jgi:hypothetical protein